jgi:hypothetical protein
VNITPEKEEDNKQNPGIPGLREILQDLTNKTAVFGRNTIQLTLGKKSCILILVYQKQYDQTKGKKEKGFEKFLNYVWHLSELG